MGEALISTSKYNRWGLKFNICTLIKLVKIKSSLD